MHSLRMHPPIPPTAVNTMRQVAGLPVFGVAIPTVSGLRLVLERLGAAHGRRKVLWHNQREEPVM